MLSLTQLITIVKMDSYIYGVPLPFDDIDKVLMDVLRLKTIPTYSRISPYRLRYKVEFDRLREIDRLGEGVTYILPNLFGDKKIIRIEKVEPYYQYTGNTAIGSSVSYCDIKDMMLGSQNAFLSNYISPKRSFEFIEPNKVVLYNFPNTDLLFHFGISHDINLSTIDEGHSESFTELATYDVQKFLYDSLMGYNEIQTAHGNYKLPVDRWADAESKRKDLLDKWESTAHLDGTILYYIT